jgi:hypothetical protein
MNADPEHWFQAKIYVKYCEIIQVEIKALLGLCYFRGIDQHNLVKAEVSFLFSCYTLSST